LKLFKLKVYIFFLFFFLITFSYSKNLDECSSYKLSKVSNRTNNFLLPKKISIKINNNKKFQINNFKVLVSKKTIKKKFKKRYSANVKVFYKDRICNYKARIRIHGDFTDHILWKNGNIIQSLDVHLKEGNINGITKFKLLLPRTRANPNEEILITELFRSLNILAPKTFYINVNNQSNNYLALFQEKIEKEFLESNQRKESVILEGDERFLFDNFEKNIDWDSKLISLSKVSNNELLEKSKDYRNILLSSLSNLNKFYLNKKTYFEFREVWYYDMKNLNDKKLINSNSFDQRNKFDIFNSIIFATNSQHALNPHNRKFYWNKEYQSFEPIYYDGNIAIDNEINKDDLPKNKEFYEGVLLTQNLINNLNNKIFIDKVLKNLNVVNGNFNEINRKVNKIKSNLYEIINLKNNNDEYSNLKDDDHYINLKNYLSKLDKNIYPIFLDTELKSFYKCDIVKCKIIDLSNNELSLLINGNLKKEDNYYQFVGINKIVKSKLIFEDVSANEKFKIINFKNSKIIYNEDEYVIQDLKDNLIRIKQLIPNTRMIISGGNLENLKIQANFIPQYKNLNEKTFGIRGLTGCLNLIDLEIKNIDIEILNSNCEDGINIIRSLGSIDSLYAFQSSNDAVDIDFSEIKISKLNISHSGNDCIDLSYGNYHIVNSTIDNCGDKAISVGEKSRLKIQNTRISNANTGIASKDGSYVKLDKGFFNNLELCLSSYIKKQEFFGASMDVAKFECQNSTKKIFEDNYSNIVFYD
jgi:hypothetical protein